MRHRVFQFGLLSLFGAVTVAALAAWAWSVSVFASFLAASAIEAVFAGTYVLLRQAQHGDNRNSNRNQSDFPSRTPWL